VSFPQRSVHELPLTVLLTFRLESKSGMVGQAEWNLHVRGLKEGSSIILNAPIPASSRDECRRSPLAYRKVQRKNYQI
jgi:hypothetical protein